MDIRTFCKEAKRMCDSFVSCAACPINESRCCICDIEEKESEVNDIVEYIEKWAADHPQKTLLQDLLEKYPDTKLDDQGIPCDICPSNLGFSDSPKCPSPEENMCTECWGRSVDDAKEAAK